MAKIFTEFGGGGLGGLGGPKAKSGMNKLKKKIENKNFFINLSLKSQW
jgi:hypothetical protein